MHRRPILIGFVVGAIAILVFFGMGLLALSVIPASSRPSSFLGSDNIGVVEIVDVIYSSEHALEQIKNFRDDESIRALLVRIDSPGGSVGPSQEIFSELMKTRAQKPVVASLGAVAASGGYYIASGANLIVANPGTLTGSIGAIMEFLNIKGLYEWARIDSEVIKSGEHKDMGSLTRNLSAEERRLLSDVVQNVLDQFISAIAEGRRMPAESIRPIADGRIFTGAQAQSLGLVDRLGNFNDAVDAAAELAGISGEPNLVRAKEKKVDMLDLILDDVVGKFGARLERRFGALPARHGAVNLKYQY